MTTLKDMRAAAISELTKQAQADRAGTPYFRSEGDEAVVKIDGDVDLDAVVVAAMLPLLEKIVGFVATHTELESILLTPVPGHMMNDPYGLLDLIRDECGIAPDQIDKWMCEAQGIPQATT